MNVLRWVFIITFALTAVAVLAAGTPLVQKMLPHRGSVKDFAIVRDSLVYGKGSDLAKIYDGGYELYTKNGVIDAARQMYVRKDDYVEVIVHTMKSDKAALGFLKYWQKEHKAAKLTTSKTSSSFLVTKPSVMSYSVTGKYLVTVSALYSGEAAPTDVKSFAAVTQKNIVDLTKPSSSAKGK